MNLGSDLKGHGIQRRLLCVVCAAALVLLVGCEMASGHRAEQALPQLAYPQVAFNFDPNVPSGEGENAYWDRSVYLYDIPTKEVEAFCNDDIYINDCDLQRMLALGVTDTDVVEVDLKTGEYRKLGPLQYEGEEVDIYSVQWRPNSEDYSAVTFDGQLLLWRHDAQAFEVLTHIDNGLKPTEWMYYDHIWFHKGRDVCIPDPQGLSILNVETGETEHWLDLDIDFNGGSQKSYDVLDDGSKVVYVSKREIRLIQIGEDGSQDETTLIHSDSMGEKGFAISPDGKGVVFAVCIKKDAIVTPGPQYYEVWLYQDGELIKLFEADTNSKDTRVYW